MAGDLQTSTPMSRRPGSPDTNWAGTGAGQATGGVEIADSATDVHSMDG
jgi:hypothetical protein